VPVSVDIATGDPITPSSIVYSYKCLFSDEVLNFNSYNFETILAEKLHTILNREENNSRSKDFYDIYIIQKLRFNEINLNQLMLAFKNTCSHRDFDISKEKASDIVNKIKHDDKMIIRWNSYVRKNKFASGISFAETISAVENLLTIVF
jgi:predicted nucleotidyltransferase component of viral defense system